MRRCFALLYTRVSFLPISLPSFLPSFHPPFAPPPSSPHLARASPRDVGGERSGCVLYPFGTLLSPSLSTETETRFSPLVREKLGTVTSSLFDSLEEGFLRIVRMTEKSIESRLLAASFYLNQELCPAESLSSKERRKRMHASDLHSFYFVLRSHELIAQNSRLCIQSESDNASVRLESIGEKDFRTSSGSFLLSNREREREREREKERKREPKDTHACETRNPRRQKFHVTRHASLENISPPYTTGCSRASPIRLRTYYSSKKHLILLCVPKLIVNEEGIENRDGSRDLISIFDAGRKSRLYIGNKSSEIYTLQFLRTIESYNPHCYLPFLLKSLLSLPTAPITSLRLFFFMSDQSKSRTE
ncbi:hypothetical protein ALC62_06167 [Cyphomyrmex costatus]|uniref:Uncharacterized protein n=1 Tax=Cyphomyrmex costatus TaxID=456900 RepID=A0A195CRF1_9HYME|nr:hypothetical protein ALC62_06167 [Cyphomyrmex costatus]